MKTTKTSETRAGRILALAVLLTSAASASADPYRGMAKGFSRAAAAAGVTRVAVLPFSAVDGSDGIEGRLQAERLTTQMSRFAAIQVVERSLLQPLMKEQFLGRTGALDAQGLARIGRLAQAQAVLTGTFAALGDTVEVNVRLVNVETGIVLAADQESFDRADAPISLIFPAPAFLSAEQAVADVVAFQRGETATPQAGVAESDPPYRDALSETDCRRASERVDAMEESILTLKARYWAGQATMAGFSPSSLSRQPGAVISDPELRQKFFALLQQYAARPAAALTMSEVQRFTAIDGKAFQLHRTCSL